VIDSLQALTVGNGRSAPLAYFYCSGNEPDRSSPAVIMRTILKQLCLPNAGHFIPEGIARKYNQLRGGTSNPAQLSLEECVDLILALLDSDPAVIVIDALDEGDRKLRRRLLLAFEKIVENSASIVKIFISSRDERDIEHRLNLSPNVQIGASDNGEDIKRFILTEVDGAIRDGVLLRGNIPEELRMKIINVIMEGAQGM
jgi:hypothetical protein